MARALYGDEWPKGFGGGAPIIKQAFSLEEAPTFGRGSSLVHLKLIFSLLSKIILI